MKMAFCSANDKSIVYSPIINLTRTDIVMDQYAPAPGGPLPTDRHKTLEVPLMCSRAPVLTQIGPSILRFLKQIRHYDDDDIFSSKPASLSAHARFSTPLPVL